MENRDNMFGKRLYTLIDWCVKDGSADEVSVRDRETRAALVIEAFHRFALAHSSVLAIAEASASKSVFALIRERLDEVRSLNDIIHSYGIDDNSSGVEWLDGLRCAFIELCNEYAKIQDDALNLARVATDTRCADRDKIRVYLQEALREQLDSLSRDVKRSARAGAREGVIDYNKRYILNGEAITRKKGGGRKAEKDVRYLQCQALLTLGQEAKDKRKPKQSYTDYARVVIRKPFPADDRPFVFANGGQGRKDGAVCTALLHRFDTFLKGRNGGKLSREDALPLARASE